jgi:hypothetical protein
MPVKKKKDGLVKISIACALLCFVLGLLSCPRPEKFNHHKLHQFLHWTVVDWSSPGRRGVKNDARSYEWHGVDLRCLDHS